MKLTQNFEHSLILDGTLDTQTIQDMINHSYELVVKGLRKVDRLALQRKHTMESL